MRVRDIKRVACASDNNILCMYVLYMCLCLCRKKREKEREKESAREKKHVL